MDAAHWSNLQLRLELWTATSLRLDRYAGIFDELAERLQSSFDFSPAAPREPGVELHVERGQVKVLTLIKGDNMIKLDLTLINGQSQFTATVSGPVFWRRFYTDKIEEECASLARNKSVHNRENAKAGFRLW